MVWVNEANDISLILYKWFRYVLIIQMLPTFSQNVTLQEVFETAAQINEDLKVMEFDGTFWENLNF